MYGLGPRFGSQFTKSFGLNQIAALEEDLDKSPDKKPAINKLIDRAIPK